MPSSDEADLFIGKYDAFINTRNSLIVVLILSSAIYFLIYVLSLRFLLHPGIVSGWASAIYLVVFAVVFLYLANIRMRIRDGDELTYGLCKTYREMGRVGGRGKQSKEKLEDVKRELVKGPIKYLRSAIKESKDRRPSVFSSKFVSLLEKAQKSLIHQIYPILHKGKIKDIPKARDYLLATIETRINGDFDGYEVALDNLGKGLPVEEVKISEMRTYADMMKNWLHVAHDIWARNIVLKFLTFCGGIGVVFYVASFFIQISPEGALMTTILASAALSAVSISR